MLQERRTQFLGAIRIGRNPSFTRVTAVAVLLAAALVAYAAWGQITRKARVDGVLVAVDGAADGPGALAAHLYAPARTVGFIRPGQPVRLRYAAYPYATFGVGRGEVESVDRTPLPAADLAAGSAAAGSSAVQGGEPAYRITVALESQSIGPRGLGQPLERGMTLEADVIQERRRIWEWLLDPALRASGRDGPGTGPAR